MSVSLLLGNNGVLNKAQSAITENRNGTAKEEVSMAWATCEVDYQAKWSLDHSLTKAEFFTTDTLNPNLVDKGTVLSVDYVEDGESTVVYQSNDNNIIYTIKIDEIGNVNIDSTTVADTTSVKIKVGSNEETITSSNLGEYLGTKVVYTPANPSTSYGTSTTYRIFYIDFNNDYNDGVGTIYLKADCDGKNVNLSSYTSYTSTDGYAVMKNLNPSWVQPASGSFQTNDNCVAWITDPNMWDDWKSSATELNGKINYVVGAPSLEMYVDSYNKYIAAHSSAVLNGTSTLAKALKCEYVTSNYNAKGYRIGFSEVATGSWANTGYYQDSNSIIGSGEANAMYNPGSGKYYWLASPAANGAGNVMLVDGSNSRVDGYYSYGYAFCPLVSLDSSVVLEKAD